MRDVGRGIVQVVIVFGLDVRHIRKVEDDGEHDHHSGNDCVRDIESFVSSASARGVGGIEEHAADYRAEDPADAVAGLCEVDARGGVVAVTQNGSVRVSNGFQERQSRGDDTDTREEAHEGGI